MNFNVSLWMLVTVPFLINMLGLGHILLDWSPFL